MNMINMTQTYRSSLFFVQVSASWMFWNAPIFTLHQKTFMFKTLKLTQCLPVLPVRSVPSSG